MSEERLKYKDLSDEEVEELILKRLKEIRGLLEEIKTIFQKAGV
ncbi:MAG: hypothetical protein ABWK01_01275 [Infirmifilum sp.]